MSVQQLSNWRDSLIEIGYRIACKYPRLRACHRQNPAPLMLTIAPNLCQHIEVVSHCWQYAHLLQHQLHALLAHPPRRVRVTMTVFYSDTDALTANLLAFYKSHSLAGVTWQFIPLPPAQLYRRAIGRNYAARTSQADWLWFTDCDVIVGEGCFDRLADSLRRTSAPLVYPEREYRSPVLAAGHPLLSECNYTDSTSAIPLLEFSVYTLDRATGPYQIVRGDLARTLGYCPTPRVFQKPAKHWRKATEDRVFRWLLGTDGVAIDAGDVYRIQHREKGRYRKGGWLRNCLLELRASVQARHIRKLAENQNR